MAHPSRYLCESPRRAFAALPSVWRGTTPRPGAFTILELLVVMAIVVIILAVTFPAYDQLTAGNGKKQAVNAISVQVASARSLALATQRQVGLVFFDDPQRKNSTNMVLVQMLHDPVTGAELGFGAIPERPPVALPKNIKVANFSVTSTNAAFKAGWASSAGEQCRALVFDHRGQLVIRGSLKGYDVGGTSVRSARSEWGLYSGTGDALDFSSTIAMVLYDLTEFNAVSPTFLTNSDAAAWLTSYSDIIAIHPYTGTVVPPDLVVR